LGSGDRLRLIWRGCRPESLYPYITTLDTGSVNSESRSTAACRLLFNDAFFGDRYTSAVCPCRAGRQKDSTLDSPPPSAQPMQRFPTTWASPQWSKRRSIGSLLEPGVRVLVEPLYRQWLLSTKHF